MKKNGVLKLFFSQTFSKGKSLHALIKRVLLLLLLLTESNSVLSTNAFNYQGDFFMEKYSQGRLDYVLPKNFKQKGRDQSIYSVKVKEISLNNKSLLEDWTNRVEQFRLKHLASGNNIDTMSVGEILPGFYYAFYHEDDDLDVITVEAHKLIGDNVLCLKYTGMVGKEKNMLRQVSGPAEGYRPNINRGFNIGEGSLTSGPSINEMTFAVFEDDRGMFELSIRTDTVGSYLNKGPLDNIAYEIEGLRIEGIVLKVEQKGERVVAGFPGEEGLVTFENPKEKEANFKFTWFYTGETAKAYKPEIRIKLIGKLDDLEVAKKVWTNLMNSITMRK